MANFSFDKPFMKMFGEMNEAFDSMVDKIKKYNVSDHEYGVCTSSYKMRFITPQNVSEYIDMLAKAFANRMIETPGDIERFSVEAAKRMIKENACDAFTPAVPMGYTPNASTYTTLMEIISGIKNDCFNKSCYSQFDLRQRQSEVLQDLEKIKGLKFYTSMKSLVNGIPAVMKASDIISNIKDDVADIIVEAIEEFIIFAYSVNIITVLQMTEYLIPSQTYTTTKNTHDSVVTECALLKTVNTDLKLNLPCSINIRNLVLEDMTDFSSVKNAIKYITTNPKSPIAEMIQRYTSDTSREELERNAGKTFTIIDRLFKYGYRGSSSCPEQIKSELMNPKETPWLDELANGNQFIDGSYRHDKQFTGNITQSPFTASLDMVYKVFNGCGCDLTTNEELSLNIMKVSNAMYQTADKLKCVENPELVRDVLALLGEIMTRDIIMLVSNNTNVIDCGSFDYSNSGTPAYLYSESFDFDVDDAEYFMEADENTAVNTVSNNKNEKVKVTYKNSNGDEKKVKARMQAFMNWVRRVLASIFKKFNKDHAAEIKYVNEHKEQNEKILKALQDKTFVINVENLPKFDIKLEEVKPKITETVNEFLDTTKTEKFDIKKFEAGLYPGKDDTTKMAIVNAGTNDKKSEAIANVLLYGQVTKPQSYTGPLTAERWSEMIEQLTKSFNLIESYTNNLSQDLTNANNVINNKMNITLPENAAETKPKEAEEKHRATEMSKIMTDRSNIFATTTVNTLMKKFYATEYDTYASIVKAFKQQHKDDDNKTETTNTNTATEENPPANADANNATPAAEQNGGEQA